jgi:hypothetical protein
MERAFPCRKCDDILKEINVEVGNKLPCDSRSSNPTFQFNFCYGIGCPGLECQNFQCVRLAFINQVIVFSCHEGEDFISKRCNIYV